jgi:hypothetical protein
MRCPRRGSPHSTFKNILPDTLVFRFHLLVTNGIFFGYISSESNSSHFSLDLLCPPLTCTSCSTTFRSSACSLGADCFSTRWFGARSW